MCIAEIKPWPCYFDNGFSLRNSLSGGAKLTKNADSGKYSYSVYSISFDVHGTFSLPNRSFGKNVVIFGADMSSSVHINNKEKDILILGRGPTQGLDDTTLTAKTEYSINFAEKGKKFWLSLLYNKSSSYLFVNGVKIYHFKAEDSDLNEYSVCLGNISKKVSNANLKQTGLNGCVCDFSVNLGNIDVSDILDIR